jgi:hypothetical protein
VRLLRRFAPCNDRLFNAFVLPKLSDFLAKMKKNVELKPLKITSGIHPISEKEPCHSCENRNPGSWLIFWIPASAGMTTLNNSIVKSLNLGYNKNFIK